MKSKEKENLDEIEDILDKYLDKKESKSSKSKTTKSNTSTTKKTTTKKDKNTKEVVDDDEDEKENKKNPIIAIILGLVIAAIILLLLLKGCNKTQEYTVSFNSGGGNKIQSVVIEENGTIKRPTDPTKEGYTFAGWYYKDKEFDFSTKVTRDMVLEARWEPNEPEKPNKITLSDDNMSLLLGTNGKVIISSLPEGVKESDLEWISSNSNVVTVSSDGMIKSVGEGTATITVKSKDGVYSATCNITVTKEEVKAESVEITGATEVTVGSSARLIATVKPTDTTDKKVTWTSSNPSVATVDANGNIRALKEGTVTITVTTSNGKKATKTITIKPATSNSNSNSNTTSNKPSNTTSNKTSNATSNKPSNATSNKPSNTTVDATSVTITGASAVNVNNTIKLAASIKPANVTNKNIVWKSSDPSVATVDANGIVKGIKEGTVTITATSGDGKAFATKEVTVNSIYVITLTPIVQDTTNAVMQYSFTVTRDGAPFTDYSGFTYNGKPVSSTQKTIQKNNVNTSVTTAQIKMKDGTTRTATVVYK